MQELSTVICELEDTVKALSVTAPPGASEQQLQFPVPSQIQPMAEQDPIATGEVLNPPPAISTDHVQPQPLMGCTWICKCKSIVLKQEYTLSTIKKG